MSIFQILFAISNYFVIANGFTSKTQWNFCRSNYESLSVSSYKIKGTKSLRSTFENSISEVPTTTNTTPLPNLEQRRPLKTALLALAARTVRGQIASNEEKAKAKALIDDLEKYKPINDPCLSELCYGSWELIYSNTNLFRSSPFFMAARAICKEGDEADRFNLFCDLHQQALAFTNIGKVRQIITNEYGSNDRLISEFETSAYLIPGLNFPKVTGTIVSSSDIMAKTANSWSLYMDKVRIKESSSNIPFIRLFLDTFEGLPIRVLGDKLEDLAGQQWGYMNPYPVFRTIYVDTHMRISLDQDDNVFVYNRVD